MKRVLLVFAMLIAVAGLARAAVNINTAGKEELMSIKGVGDQRAQAIIDYRTKNGPFKSLDDLTKVPGIGPDFLKRIRSRVTIGAKGAGDKPARQVTIRTGSASPQPAKSAALKSDRASGKVAAKLTSGSKTEQKKSK